MRIIYTTISLLFSASVWAEGTGARSVLEGKSGECGLNTDTLRRGDIHMEAIPCIIVNITNNLLGLVGYVSIGVIMVGALMYVFGGVNEEAKSKGKEAIKLAIIGAVVSWSAWLVVNFVIDNV